MSDDEFSRPDPPDMPTSPPTDEQLTGDVTIAGEDVDCRNCIHFEVCAYFAGVQPMLEQREDAPIDAYDLAVVCDVFEQEDA